MLTNPLAVPDVVAMDGVGNVETITAMRMVTVRLVPRASYVPGGGATATAAAKDVVVLEVPCSLTVRDVGAELLRATHSPTVAQRVREWLGVRAAARADASSAGAPAVHMYVEERCADSAELVPVAPLLRLDELVAPASDDDTRPAPELVVYFSEESSFGCYWLCCAACCAAGAATGVAIANKRNSNTNNNNQRRKPPQQARPKPKPRPSNTAGATYPGYQSHEPAQGYAVGPTYNAYPNHGGDYASEGQNNGGYYPSAGQNNGAYYPSEGPANGVYYPSEGQNNNTNPDPYMASGGHAQAGYGSPPPAQPSQQLPPTTAHPGKVQPVPL